MVSLPQKDLKLSVGPLLLGIEDEALRARLARVLSAVVDALSHELRTPLAAMQNATSILKCPDASEQQRTRALELLERNIKAQAAVIDEILQVRAEGR